MADWLDSFDNTKRVVVANFLDKLSLRLEQNSKKQRHASIEEALEDFAQRTGLTQMQKRALRRQAMLKLAFDFTEVDREHDLQQVEFGDAPASILPGVKPGTENEKKIEKKLYDKKIDKNRKKEEINKGEIDLGEISRTDLESMTSVIGSLTSKAVGGFKKVKTETAPQPFTKMPKSRYTVPKPSWKQEPARKVNRKERNIQDQIDSMKISLRRFLDETTGEVRKLDKNEWVEYEEMKSQLDQLQQGLEEFREEKKQQDAIDEPDHVAALNDKEFLSEFDKMLGVDMSATTVSSREKQRTEKLKQITENTLYFGDESSRMNPELQKAFEQAAITFKREGPHEGLKTYYKKSQGYYAKTDRGIEIFDFVECLACKENAEWNKTHSEKEQRPDRSNATATRRVKGTQLGEPYRTWINEKDPGRLSYEHLKSHIADFKRDGQLKENPEDVNKEYRQDLVDVYLNTYPGASLQSRENEFATFVQDKINSNLDRTRDKQLLLVSSTQKDLNYTDDIVKDLIAKRLRNLEVDWVDASQKNLVNKILESVKNKLQLKFPHLDLRGDIGRIGKEHTNVPFSAFYGTLENEIVKAVENDPDVQRMHQRRKTKSRNIPRTRQHKDWVMTQRIKDYEMKDAEKQAEEEVWKKITDSGEVDRLTEDQIEERIEERIRQIVESKELVEVPLSSTVKDEQGNSVCWNCKTKHQIKVKNNVKTRNSVTCPNCNAFKEVRITSNAMHRKALHQDEIGYWVCPECGERKSAVIRDPNNVNEADNQSGVKYYTMYCDESKNGTGAAARGNDKYIFVIETKDAVKKDWKYNKELQTVVPTEIKEEINIGDKVITKEGDIGSVVFILGLSYFVDLPNKKTTVAFNNSRGQVIYLPEQGQYFFVQDIHDDKKTAEIIMKLMDSKGTQFEQRYFYNEKPATLKNVFRTVKRDINVVACDNSRQMRRKALLRKICKQGCSGYEVLTIQRNVVPQSTACLTDFLKRVVNRARMICAMFRRSV